MPFAFPLCLSAKENPTRYELLGDFLLKHQDVLLVEFDADR